MRSKNSESFKGKKPWTSLTTNITWPRRLEDSTWMTSLLTHIWLRSFNSCLRSCNLMRPWILISTTRRETWWEIKEEDHIIKTEEDTTTRTEGDIIKVVVIITGTNRINSTTNSNQWVDNKLEECHNLVECHNQEECQVHKECSKRECHRLLNHHSQQVCHKCQDNHRCQLCQEFNNLTKLKWPHNRNTSWLLKDCSHLSLRETSTWRNKLDKPFTNSSLCWFHKTELQRLQVCLSNFQSNRSSNTCNHSMHSDKRFLRHLNSSTALRIK